MLDAIMLWNEPNNKSHWMFEIDPDWKLFSHMATLASQAIRAQSPKLIQVLGGISPIDPSFLRLLRSHGLIDHLDALAVHGFPLDWNHWSLNEWPDKLKEIKSVAEDKPVWVSEVGVSTFGAEEAQDSALNPTAALLIGNAPRTHWSSLFDLPKAGPATTRHREAEGSAYYRHFYMG